MNNKTISLSNVIKWLKNEKQNKTIEWIIIVRTVE